MTRMIKDYVQVGEFTSLDEAIARLCAIRDSLPAEAEAEITIRGDGAFGMHLCVAYRRPLNAEEAACEGRYVDRSVRGLKSAA